MKNKVVLKQSVTGSYLEALAKQSSDLNLNKRHWIDSLRSQ